MQNKRIVLFDTPESHANLLPLSYTRPVADFRLGITTLREKWECLVPGSYSYLTEEYLTAKFPLNLKDDEEALFVSGDVIADEALAVSVGSLRTGGLLADSVGVVAYCGTLKAFRDLGKPAPNMDKDVLRVRYAFDLFLLNADAIKADYRRLASGGKGVAPDSSTRIIGPAVTPEGLPSLYIEEGATVEGAVINVKEGPVYIGRDAVVMEGSCLRGPLALCEHSVIRMGAKIYGGSTFGPYCKIGGEVDNSVIFGYSNKAHDGYLGNAVIGEWCNIGAGANASNLKNDYAMIRVWNYSRQSFMRTDLQFCGLIMGDHSKAGINTMFNTATVVGVCVNLHGSGFPRAFVPSFSIGSPEGGFTDVDIDKFMATAVKVMARRGKTLTDVDRAIFDHIYASASRFK